MDGQLWLPAIVSYRRWRRTGIDVHRGLNAVIDYNVILNRADNGVIVNEWSLGVPATITIQYITGAGVVRRQQFS